MAGDTVDKEIEDRFGGLLGIGLGDTPALKMTVDVHPGKAVHQGAAGNLHPFRIRRAQLSLHGGLRLPGPSAPARPWPNAWTRWHGAAADRDGIKPIRANGARGLTADISHPRRYVVASRRASATDCMPWPLPFLREPL